MNRKLPNAQCPGPNQILQLEWQGALRDFLYSDRELDHIVNVFAHKCALMGVRNVNWATSMLMDLSWSISLLTWRAFQAGGLPEIDTSNMMQLHYTMAVGAGDQAVGSVDQGGFEDTMAALGIDAVSGITKLPHGVPSLGEGLNTGAEPRYLGEAHPPCGPPPHDAWCDLMGGFDGVDDPGRSPAHSPGYSTRGSLVHSPRDGRSPRGRSKQGPGPSRAGGLAGAVTSGQGADAAGGASPSPIRKKTQKLFQSDVNGRASHGKVLVGTVKDAKYQELQKKFNTMREQYLKEITLLRNGKRDQSSRWTGDMAAAVDAAMDHDILVYMPEDTFEADQKPYFIAAVDECVRVAMMKFQGECYHCKHLEKQLKKALEDLEAGRLADKRDNTLHVPKTLRC